MPDKYGQYAEETLAERGIIYPSTELLRLEMVCIHLDEARCLASLLGQRAIEQAIATVLLRVRTQLSMVADFSRIDG